MPARIKMLVTLEPVEVWVELPDYVDEGVGQAAEDAAAALRGVPARVSMVVPSPGGAAYGVDTGTSVASAEAVFLGEGTFIVEEG